MKKTNDIRLLEKEKVPFDLLEYTYDATDLSVEKIAEANQIKLAQLFKTLVVKGDKTGIVVALVAGQHSLSLKKLAKYTGNKKMALLPVKEIQRYTGYVRGGCSPLGMKKKYPILIDRSAQAFEHIYVNAGQRGLLFGCHPEKLFELCQAKVGDIISQE